MKYDAFISYRHMPLDMEIAKKLHKGLETFPVPKSVRESSGKKKIERVFRDQEELPIGSNLTEEITAALAESEYLIVVCSHHTPESVWVQREIETFISMHDRSHVLAILIEGEPEDSFPKQLLVDDEGNSVEPLAADIRGETPQERNKKFNTELLRLAAPILGCSYDDLKQRHRERMIRRLVIEISALAGTVALATTLFGVYNAKVAKEMENLANDKAALAEQMSALAAEKTQLADDIMLEYQDKLENQSRFYAQKSLSLLSEGNRRAALLVAAEALPVDGGNRPYVPEAEYAFASALRVYDFPTDIDFDRTLDHDQVVRDLKLCSDGKRVLTEDTGHNLHVWSVDSWKEVMYVSHVLKDNQNYYADVVNADADEDSLYIATQEGIYRYNNTGNVIWHEPTRDQVKYAELCPIYNHAMVVFNDYIQIYDTRNGIVLYTFDNEAESGFARYTASKPDIGLYVCCHEDVEEGGTAISFIHMDEGSMTDVRCSGNNIMKVCMTDSGNTAVLSCEKDYLFTGDLGEMYLDLFDPDGQVLWSDTLDIEIKSWTTFRINLQARSYDYGNGVPEHGLLFSIEDKVFYINEEDGTNICGMLFDEDTMFVLTSDDSRYIYVGFDSGEITPVDPSDGMMYTGSSIVTKKNLLAGIEINGRILFRSALSYQVGIVGYPDLETVPKAAPLDEITEDMNCFGWSASGGFYVLADTITGAIYFYDKNGDQIYNDDIGAMILEQVFYEDKYLVIANKEMILIDPVAGKTDRFSYKNMGIDVYTADVTVTNNGAYVTISCSKSVYVIDVATHSVIFEYETEENVGKAVTTDDGSRLYISQESTDLYYVNLSTGDRVDMIGERLRQVRDLQSHSYLVLSPDGRFTAMCCLDSRIRIVENRTNKVIDEIPMGVATRIYMKFTDDGEKLIAQGDDYRVRIWGLSEHKWIGSCDAYYSIRYTTSSADNKYLALCDLSGIYLLEADTFKPLAKWPYAMVYIPDDNTFFQRKNGVVYCRQYMPVSELYEEFKRQFPDASLTDEERDIYNIN